MKKQQLLVLGLGTIIGLGSLFGGGVVHADEMNSSETKNQCIEEVGGQCLDDELIKNGVLTKAELKQCNDAIDKIMKLYDDLEEKNLSDEVLNKLISDENKIYEDNKVIFDKVDKYYNSLEDAPYNKEVNEEEYAKEHQQEIQELVGEGIITEKEGDRLIVIENELDQIFDKISDDESHLNLELEKKLNELYKEMDEIYEKIDLGTLKKELKEIGVLSNKEIDQFMKAQNEINKIYKKMAEQGLTDAEYEKLFDQIEKVDKANKTIFDKVDNYYSSLNEGSVEYEDYYAELVKAGQMTQAESDALKAIDEQVEKLLESLPEDASDADYEKLDKQIDDLYKELDK